MILVQTTGSTSIILAPILKASGMALAVLISEIFIVIFEFTYLNFAIFYYKNPFQYFESAVDQTQWFTLLLCIFFLFNKTSYLVFLSLEELAIFFIFWLVSLFTLFGLFLLEILYNFFFRSSTSATP